MATVEALKALEDRINTNTHSFDINKSLGLTRETLQYDSRLEALTTPAQYARKRGEEWGRMG